MQNDNTMQANKPYYVEVDESHDGQRLDNFLFTTLKGVPKTLVYRIIRKGEVRVNKSRAKPTTRIAHGDQVRIPPIRQSAQINVNIDPKKFAFLEDAILFEDETLLVINKPSGMAVHAGSGIKVGLIEAMRSNRPKAKFLELVHRLDRQTSGCLVLAKKANALKLLHEDFKNNSMKNPRLDKRYLVLVKGRWHGGERRVTKALNTQARKQGERVVEVDLNGRYASSIFTPVSTSKLASLLEVKLLTGRTHQVRVHALSEGHPVAGDERYGDAAFNKIMKQQTRLKRLFLHAASVELYHPVTDQKIKIEAPLTDDLTDVLSRCMN